METTIDFYAGKKVLVAGGTGLVGIPLVKKLVDFGALVTTVSMEDNDFAEKVFGDLDTHRHIEWDLTNRDACYMVTKGIDYVFNLTANKRSVGVGNTTLAKDFYDAILLNTHLMHYAWENGVTRFLHAGSICEYPQMRKPKKETMMWDGLPVLNDMTGGITKRIGEIQARAYRLQHNWSAVRIVRMANIYGPHDVFDAERGQVVPALIKKALDAKDTLEVWGHPDTIRDLVYVDDVVDGSLLALASDNFYPVNLSGQWTKIGALAKIIVKKVNKDLEIKWNAEKPSGDPVRKLCGNWAREAIGYGPKVTLNKGIEWTINWYLKHGDNYVR